MPECVSNVTIVTHLTHISNSPLYSPNILPETWSFLVYSPEHRKGLLSKYYTAKSQNDVFYNCNHNLPGGFLCCRDSPPRAIEERYDYPDLASLITRAPGPRKQLRLRPRLSSLNRLVFWKLRSNWRLTATRCLLFFNILKIVSVMWSCFICSIEILLG